MFADKVRAIRKAKNMTLSAFAKELGIKSSGHVSMIENGEREPFSNKEK